MAKYLDIFGFVNARYPRASVSHVMVPAMKVSSREAHVREMTEWAIDNGEGRFSYLADTSDIHWTTMQGYYDIPLDDRIKSRESHEMFLFTDMNTAFAFKIQFA